MDDFVMSGRRDDIKTMFRKMGFVHSNLLSDCESEADRTAALLRAMADRINKKDSAENKAWSNRFVDYSLEHG